MSTNNNMEVNDLLIAEIANLRRQISALQASNAALQSQLEALQTSCNSDKGYFLGQIYALKSSKVSLEQKIADLQSAHYQDVQSVGERIKGLESVSMFLDRKVDVFRSFYISEMGNIRSNITRLINDDNFLGLKITSLQKALTQLANRAQHAETELSHIKSSLSLISKEAGRLNALIREGRAMLMNKLQTLEDNLSKVMRKNNMEVTEMREMNMKLVIRKEVQQNRLAKDERDAEHSSANLVDRDAEHSSANLVDTTNALAQVEQESQSPTEEIGRLQEAIKESQKFRFWAVLSSTVVTAASLAYVACRRR